MSVTAAQLRDRHGRLLLGCRCGWQRYADLASIPAELEAETIEALQRSGRWRCQACGGPAVAMVYQNAADTVLRQTERWAHGHDAAG
jgi:hypothetical protein